MLFFFFFFFFEEGHQGFKILTGGRASDGSLSPGSFFPQLLPHILHPFVFLYLVAILPLQKTYPPILTFFPQLPPHFTHNFVAIFPLKKTYPPIAIFLPLIASPLPHSLVAISLLKKTYPIFLLSTTSPITPIILLLFSPPAEDLQHTLQGSNVIFLPSTACPSPQGC